MKDSIDSLRGRWIAPQDVAATLANSECTIHRWIREGKIDAIKPGYRMTRVNGDSLADYLTANIIKPKKSTENERG